MQIGPLFQFGQSFNENACSEDPADTQSRKGDLRETANLDDCTGGIQGLESRERVALVTQFTVNIILNHRNTGTGCELKQGLTGGKRDGGARRILEVGRDHKETGPFTGDEAVEGIEIDPLGSDGNANDAHPGTKENIPEAGIDRIFDQNGVANSGEETLEEVEGLLTAAGDDDVISRAGQAVVSSLRQQVGAKRFKALRDTELEEVGSLRTADDLRAGGAEFVEGKEIVRRPGRGETDGARTGVRGGSRWLGEEGVGEAVRPPQGTGGRGRGAVDEAATADVAANETLALQKLVSGGNGGAIQSKLTSQFASWRDFLATRETSTQNLVAKVRVQLPVKRFLQARIELRLSQHPSNRRVPYWLVSDKPIRHIGPGKLTTFTGTRDRVETSERCQPAVYTGGVELVLMKTSDVLKAWGKILQGKPPSVSIEITKECPLRCPGCYAYEEAHLGGDVTLRDLSDRKGQDLVDGVLEVADRMKPLHLSIVGGDPLVRYRELEQMVPLLIERGIHVQVVTSAFRILPQGWADLPKLTTVVSIDGLQPEHDARRAPATYDRILKNIVGQKITVHSTITGQMMKRPGYLREFLEFWTPRPEIHKVWFSLFTPQVGDDLPEMLTAGERARVITELMELRVAFPKLDMPVGMIRQFAKPPSKPEDCVFALTTEVLSADFRTKVKPCQFGGTPDCSSCGCIASMALAAVADHKLGGVVPVGGIFRASVKVGQAWSGASKGNPAVDDPFKILPPVSPEREG
jgi:sulfatase maturation enzyme AslB (radical SAM superfamily)